MTDSISPQEKEHLIKVITEVLTKYDSQVEKQDISDFTNQFIEQRETLKTLENVNGFLSEVNSSFAAIDSINDYHKSLINTQNQGKSKLTWFRATIESITNVKDVQKIEKITQEVQSALIKSNNQHLSSLLDETVEVFVSQNDKKAETTNQQDLSRELLGDIQNNSLLTIISTTRELDSFSQKLNFTSDKNVLSIVTNFFEGELGDADESLITKLVTFGVMVADVEVPIEGLHDIDPTGIAVMVDTGLILTKVGYKLSQGKVSVQRAMEFIYERAISDTGVLLSAVLKAKIFIGTTHIGAKIGAVVGTVAGPVGSVIGGSVGAVVGKMAGKKISQDIKSGVKRIYEVSQYDVSKVIQKTIEFGKQVGQKIQEGTKKAVNFIKSLF
jgi:hypothetical protein